MTTPTTTAATTSKWHWITKIFQKINLLTAFLLTLASLLGSLGFNIAQAMGHGATTPDPTVQLPDIPVQFANLADDRSRTVSHCIDVLLHASVPKGDGLWIAVSIPGNVYYFAQASQKSGAQADIWSAGVEVGSATPNQSAYTIQAALATPGTDKYLAGVAKNTNQQKLEYPGVTVLPPGFKLVGQAITVTRNAKAPDNCGS